MKKQLIEKKVSELDMRPYDKLIPIAKLAKELRHTEKQLLGWKRRGTGPKVTIYQGTIHYRTTDVIRWFDDQNREQHIKCAVKNPHLKCIF